MRKRENHKKGGKKEELIVVEDFRTFGAFQRLQGDPRRRGRGVGGKRKTYKGALGISDGEGNVRSNGDGCVG